MYSSNDGHTSIIVFLPVICRMRLNNTNVQVGTPDIEVTFSLIVLLASFSILLSHSSIKAMLSSGVRSQCPQKGVFCNNTALRSPYCASVFIGLILWLPPSTNPLPVSNTESGLKL